MSALPGTEITDYLHGGSGISSGPPPAAVWEAASAAGCVLVSDRVRARESVARLVAAERVMVEPELREAALPESLPFDTRLSPGAWVVLARVAWWLDWCESDETIAMTRQRAVRVADRLGSLAAEHGSVVAVGHGMFNRFVARELRRRGWRGPRWWPHGYWALAQFEHAKRLA